MSVIDMGDTVIVAGTGKSGMAAARLLLDKGYQVVLYDDNRKIDYSEIEELFGKGAKVSSYKGSLADEVIRDIRYAVISPGIPTDAAFVNTFRQRGIKIIGEIELAFMFEAGDVIAITGTNGKTTTTALVGEIMKKARDKVFVAGNIGMPYTDMVVKSGPGSCTVLEVSSFQLETIDSFKPKVSAILNITPDHLNRHHTMENYIRAKLDIATNQTRDEVIVLNYEDEALKEAASKLNARVIFFSSMHEPDEGVFLENGKNIIVKLDGKRTFICSTDELNLLGMHSYENVMAAVAMAWVMKVPENDIREAVTAFKSVEHRIEYVCDINGVKYYNDSKGTNPDAAIKGITSMVRPTYLIGGGYDKQADFTEWVKSFGGRVKKLVLIGETTDQIADTCDKLGFSDYIKKESLKDAVEYCRCSAESGDAVLLSPACASWDMFKSYEERGTLFKQYVRETHEG